MDILTEILGPFPDPKMKQLINEIDAKLVEIRTLANDIRSTLKGDYVINAPGLATGSSAATAIAYNAFDYIINGVGYKCAAAETALAGDDVPESTYGAFRLQIGSNGTVDLVAATANATGYASAALALAGLPALAADHAAIGTLTVISSSGAFDPGTTEISAAAVTEVFTDADTVFEAIGAAIT